MSDGPENGVSNTHEQYIDICISRENRFLLSVCESKAVRAWKPGRESLSVSDMLNVQVFGIRGGEFPGWSEYKV